MSLVTAFLLTTVAAWTEDLTGCNVGRAFGMANWSCPAEGPQPVYMVAATQRTNNTAGYALKQK